MLQCIAPFVQGLQPDTCLSYLLGVQHQTRAVIEPNLSFLSDNFTALVVSSSSAAACHLPGPRHDWHLLVPSSTLAPRA